MSTVKTWQTESTNLEDSLRLAAELGARLRGGEVIELISDIGGGKTTFTKGVVRGMGSTDHVSSPSFTLSNQYQAGELSLYHFDFYRLQEPGIMRQELAEIITDSRNVVVVEWADVVHDVLPEDRLSINIKSTGDPSRQYIFHYPESLTYLVPTV